MDGHLYGRLDGPRRRTPLAPAVVLCLLALAGCGGGGPSNNNSDGDNRAPVIESLTVTHPVAAPSGSTTVTCIASDPDGDELTYTWAASLGALTGEGATVTFTAPDSEGTATITCTVSDGQAEAEDTVDVVVASGPAPGTSSITGAVVDAETLDPIADASVYVPILGGTRATARQSYTTGPDGEYILTGVSSGVQDLIVEAPTASSYARLLLQVEVPEGVTIAIRIALLREEVIADIGRVIIDPSAVGVAPEGELWFRTTVFARDGRQLPLAPTFLVTNGIGSFPFGRPTGTFVATPLPADVDEKQGSVLAVFGAVDEAHSAVASVLVHRVNRPPTCTEVVVEPTSVAAGGSVVVTMVATDADNDILTYSWQYAGTISGAGRQVVWTPPTTPGDYPHEHTITGIVEDGFPGGRCQSSATVTVTAPPEAPSTTGIVALDRTSYVGVDSVATVTVVDADLAGSGTVQVAVTSATTDTAGETLTLTETDAQGVFQGTFGFERPFSQTHVTPTAGGNGLIGVYAEGGIATETITVSYTDAADADGATVTMTDTATYEEPSSTLTGLVRDSATQAPISGAVVEIDELGWQAATRSGGRYVGHFSFYDVPSGTYTLAIAVNGYVIETRRGVVVP